ncbi:hypothetical protein [Shinella sp. DD12]|uniref:hypothetical protein n=1 Tax=Shinella sp. DD12 TaxID=1410620 RepID=UPI000437CA5D|nr:hypothetical protein [Shinella sp. DD12]EYR81889.1 hypothetical protein SHLA_4c001810 [Shinella sp. DD12]
MRNLVLGTVTLLAILSWHNAEAQSPPPYTCGQYLADLTASEKTTAFYQAIGFTYGAYYMGNWRGDFKVDEDKLSRFDKSIVANCRYATGDSFFMIAMQTANDYASR